MSGRSTGMTRGAVALVAACLLAGCAGSVDFRRAEDGSWRVLEESGPPGPRLAVAPVRYDRAADQAAVEERYPGQRYAIGTDLRALQEGLVADLNRYAPRREEGAQHVRIGGSWGEDEAPSPEMFEAAREAEADLLMALDIEAFDVAYREVNGWYYPNLFVWFYFWVPSWFVADEEYGMVVRGDVRVWDVRSRARLPEEDASFEVDVETQIAVDDFDRGWSILGPLTVPGSLEAADWETLAEYRSGGPGSPSLREEGTFRLRRRVASVATRELPILLDDPAVRARRRTVHAVCAGVSTYRNEERLAPMAGAADARVLARTLEARGVPAGNVHTLLDGAATRTDLLETIRRVGRWSRADDVLIISFAGYGTRAARPSGGPDAFLLLADANPGVLGTEAGGEDRRTGALALSELEAVLADPAIGAERVLVILDAGFAGRPAHGRTVPVEGSAEVELPPGVHALDAEGRRVLTLAAGRPGDPVIELLGTGHGLFTYLLVEAIRPREEGGALADENRDGTIDIHRELVPRLEAEGVVQSRMDGVHQEPVAAGSAGSGATWFDPTTHAEGPR